MEKPIQKSMKIDEKGVKMCKNRSTIDNCWFLVLEGRQEAKKTPKGSGFGLDLGSFGVIWHDLGCLF